MKLIRKVKKKLPALQRMLEACWLNFIIREQRTFKKSSNVHVSLTSYGKRLYKVFMTIEMLFLQRTDIASVTLYISNEDMTQDQLPKTLKRLEKRGLSIRFVDENIRSYKKIYYSYLEHYKEPNNNALLVTADDDVLYSDNWLQELVDASRENCGAVVAHRCHTITLDKNGKPKAYREWNGQHEYPNLNISDNLSMPTGIGGVLYPISALRGLEQQKEAFMELCGSADDLWLKCLTFYNGVYSRECPEFCVTV